MSPYTKEERRRLMSTYGAKPGDEGDLAYKLTLEYLDWLNTQGGLRFKFFARLVGTVILSLAEFWWRVVRPYEDKKKDENGDVY